MFDFSFTVHYLMHIFKLSFFTSGQEVVSESTKNGNLTFHRVNMDIAGDYICEVNNGIGDVLQKTARIYIHGKTNKQKFH